MAEQTLTRAERLRSLKVIRRLFEEGRGGFVYPFRYIWLVDECAEGEARRSSRKEARQTCDE